MAQRNEVICPRTCNKEKLDSNPTIFCFLIFLATPKACEDLGPEIESVLQL